MVIKSSCHIEVQLIKFTPFDHSKEEMLSSEIAWPNSSSFYKRLPKASSYTDGAMRNMLADTSIAK